MESLLACPFCREMFTPSETRVCPVCDIQLRAMHELPPSHEAQLEEMAEANRTLPEDEPRHWADPGLGRGLLVVLSIAGVGAFFAPWLVQTAPEIQTLSGFQFAKKLFWLWSAGVSWIVMAGIVASRTTIRQMRGARVAVAFLAGMVVTTVAARLLMTPTPHPRIPLRFAWGWGMYLAGALGLMALYLSFRFGVEPSENPASPDDAPKGSTHESQAIH